MLPSRFSSRPFLHRRQMPVQKRKKKPPKAAVKSSQVKVKSRTKEGAGGRRTGCGPGARRSRASPWGRARGRSAAATRLCAGGSSSGNRHRSRARACPGGSPACAEEGRARRRHAYHGGEERPGRRCGMRMRVSCRCERDRGERVDAPVDVEFAQRAAVVVRRLRAGNEIEGVSSRTQTPSPRLDCRACAQAANRKIDHTHLPPHIRQLPEQTITAYTHKKKSPHQPRSSVDETRDNNAPLALDRLPVCALDDALHVELPGAVRIAPRDGRAEAARLLAHDPVFGDGRGRVGHAHGDGRAFA